MTVPDLIELALRALPRMRLPDGTFCFERRQGDHAPRGRSLRYTLMVELGLQKAQASGYRVPVEPDELDLLVWREIDGVELEPGDLGLMLWTDARRGGERGEELAARLDAALERAGGLPARLGMELGWIVTGLAHNPTAASTGSGRRMLSQALDQLLLENRAPSDLFRHHGAGGARRRFPNFATQIYAILALAVVASHGLDRRALPAARAAADRLLMLQRPDGAWPWLFDAERGTVVERYEIYSVHQHAMAPMALLALFALSGDERYLDAVELGLNWIWSHNELGAEMVDDGEALVLRSIRRRAPFDRIVLAARTGASVAGLPMPSGAAGLTELNRSDRPYSFGWLLEAWCGREDSIANVTSHAKRALLTA